MFFMPWVEIKGNILKPITDSTKIIQEKDFTGISKQAARVTEGIGDAIAGALTGKKLHYTFKGHQIPQATVKRTGSKIYLLYLVPLGAIFCFILTILGNRRKQLDFIAAFIGFTLFFTLHKQAVFFNQKKLLLDIKELWGFRASIYLFLALGILSLLKAVFRKKTGSELFLQNKPPVRNDEK